MCVGRRTGRTGLPDTDMRGSKPQKHLSGEALIADESMMAFWIPGASLPLHRSHEDIPSCGLTGHERAQVGSNCFALTALWEICQPQSQLELINHHGFSYMSEC